MTPFRILAFALLAFSATGCEQRQANPANPPGTAAERAVDRSAGTNVSGAYPMQSEGMPTNPPGTAAGRLLDREVGKTGSR
jgi:hypothetical protein